MDSETNKYLIITDEHEIKKALLADDMSVVIWEMDQYLRSEIKHGAKKYDKVRERLHELLTEHGIILDDLCR
jgi:hypothetical protein